MQACPQAARHRDMCPSAKHLRADGLEARVWRFVSGLLQDLDRLREGLERMMEVELRGEPERESRAWPDRAAEIDRKRGPFQDMAAEGLISFEELRAKLTELAENRRVAEEKLKASRGRRERAGKIEWTQDTLLESYVEMVPQAGGSNARGAAPHLQNGGVASHLVRGRDARGERHSPRPSESP